MVFSRVKGHGKRATYIFNSPIGNSWHVKLRPIRERNVLIDEAKRLKGVHGRLPSTTGVVYTHAGIVGLLWTRTVTGSPGHDLIDLLHPKELVDSLVVANCKIQAANISGLDFEPPKWAVNKSYSLSRIDKLDDLRSAGKELHPDFQHLSSGSLAQIIQAGPGESVQKVLAHGDLCMPNLLFSREGELTGVIDLGAMHVNDSRLDIALLSWCIKANMGDKWSDYFLSRFDMEESDAAIQYYRLAYDLSLEFPEPWLWVGKPKLILQRERLKRIK